MRSIKFFVFASLFLVFALIFNFSYGQKAGSKDPYENEPCVYVSTNGSDDNPGTKVLPFRTIEVAIDKGVIFGVRLVKVAEGVYTPGNGLNAGFSGVAVKHHDIKLIGGYDQNFNSIVGYSVLDGQMKVQSIIEVRNVTNAVIENFVVSGATNREKNEKNGGGIYLNKSSYSTVRNVVSSNNFVGNGAGVNVVGNSNKIIDLRILRNYGENGAGVYMEGNYNEVVNLVIQSNVSGIWGGGIFVRGVSNSVKNSTISYNSSREGGGIYVDKCVGNQFIDLVVEVNNAQNSGGGIFVNVGTGNFVKSTIKGNTSRDGGGVYGFKTVSLLIESVISENSVTRSGGGVFLENSYKSSVNSSILKNSALSGGGVFLRGDENVLLGTISENRADDKAGGIFVSGVKNIIKARIANNTSKKDGGGIYIELSKGTKVENSEIQGNKSDNIGGGVFTFKDFDTTIIDSRIVNNFSKVHGGGIAIYDSTNSSLLNLEITQNKADSVNSVIYLYKTEGIVNFVISNCTISSLPGEKGIGIFEDGLNDVLLHKILDNTFVLDTLQGGLYRDFNLDRTWLITAVNNPKFSGAAEAKGNKQK
ncbi:MAG: right-handed parallel beta-helix repeat-containing protein [Brevinematia bacterium]